MPDNDKQKELAKKVAQGVLALVKLFDIRTVGGTSQALYQFSAPPSDGFGIAQATFRAGYTVKVKFAIAPNDDTYYLRLYKVNGDDLDYVTEYTTLTQIGNTTEYSQSVSHNTANTNDNYAVILVKNQGAGQPRLPVLAIQVHIS